MNIKRGIKFWKTVYSIILIGTIILALGGVNPPSVHAQETTPGVSAPKPLIPHPFNYHKPVCPPAGKPGLARCHSEVVTDAAGAPIVSNALLTGSYGPLAFRGAYGISGITATTRTVAIVDAYDNPTVLDDLDAYSDNFGIPRLNRCPVSTGTAASPCIQKVNQNGGTTYPAYDAGWAAEIALDVQAVHAMCQNCNILLVEANDNSYTNLITAADQRAYLMGANVVSNSWGGSEGLGETLYDTYFNHPGVAYVFSTGDSNYGVQYPAASPNVTAVGGTTLYVNSDFTYNSETVWSHNGSGTGSGCSTYESKPGFQHDAGCTRRTVADVSADADPVTGAAVYITASGYTGWYQYGGTSLSAPLVAAVIAQAGGVGTTLGNSLPYANVNYGVNLRDVTSGNNGGCGGSYLCTAGTGYDGPTGLGSPLGTSAFSATVTNHTVTFNGNGSTGGSMSNQAANVPTALTLNAFTRTNFAFSGWNTLANGSGTAYTDGASYFFAADLTLYAQWRGTVTYNGNTNSGGTVPTDASSPYLAGATVTVMGNTGSLVKTGYTFTGWNTQADGLGTNYNPGSTFTMAGNTTLYAKWAQNHIVTFLGNGSTGGSTPAQTNYTTANLTLNGFTQTGYTFTGWNTAANGSGTAYINGASYSFAADLTLYAQWTALPTHTVTFLGNGNTGGSTPAQTNYTTANLTLNGFTQTGYTFTGWNTAADGSGTAYINGASYSFAADLTLYAQWTALPTHTVTFLGNGNTGGSTPAQTNYTTANLTLNGYTRTNFAFSGWNTLANGPGTPYIDGASYSFAADLTLYAQWRGTVTYNGNTNSSGTPPTDGLSPYLAGETVTVLGNTGSLVKTGYTFTGWNTQADGLGTSYDPGSTFTMTGNTTLYALWAQNHTVTFLGNGSTGGSMSNQTAAVPTALTLNSFSRTGYSFTGWNTAFDGSGTAYADGAIYPFSADATLYAQWTTLPTHTVIFNSNGGAGTMSNQVAAVPTALTLNSFTRVGYTFTGWNTAFDGSGTAYADGAIYPFSADATLYAQWTALPSYKLFLPLMLR